MIDLIHGNLQEARSSFTELKNALWKLTQEVTI